MNFIKAFSFLIVNATGLQESFFLCSIIAKIFHYSYNEKQSHQEQDNSRVKDITSLEIEEQEVESAEVNSALAHLKSLRRFTFSKSESVRLIIKRFFSVIFRICKCFKLSQKQKYFVEAQEILSQELEVERLLKALKKIDLIEKIVLSTPQSFFIPYLKPHMLGTDSSIKDGSPSIDPITAETYLKRVIASKDRASNKIFKKLIRGQSTKTLLKY